MKLVLSVFYSIFILSVSAQDTLPPLPIVDRPIKIETEWIDVLHPNGCSCGWDAQFPGGNRALQRYVEANFTPPPIPNREYRYKRIYTRFIVNEDGTLSNIRVERGICEELDEAAIHMLGQMPPWRPAGNSCHDFKSHVRLPIYVDIN